MTKQQESQQLNTENGDQPLQQDAGKGTGWQARWRALSKADKHKISLLAIALLLGLVLMYLAGLGDNMLPDTAPRPADTIPVLPLPTAGASEECLEARLTRILLAVAGAGQVSVALSYSESVASEFVINTQLTQSASEESGEDRPLSTSEQTSKIQTLAEINSAPVLVRQIMPQLNGAVIVAEGAYNPEIRAKLHHAARVLLDLPAHRIVVLPAQVVEEDV